MATGSSEEGSMNLYAANMPNSFWQLLIEPAISQTEWADAVQTAASILPRDDMCMRMDINDIMSAVLGEALFGPKRWELSWSKRLYYQLKPLMPRRLGVLLRQQYRQRQEERFALGWPIEDRFVRFQFNCVANVLRLRRRNTVPYVSLWPQSYNFALVLTHDIENEQGLAGVQDIANLEEQLGFRSSFNFVPERYSIDYGLMSDLKLRGFEIGVHGLHHDGKLFSSRRLFEQRARKINHYLSAWESVGFRSPYMHRNPEWLQTLNVEYDLSFFDTDPYEPMPGGTMSIWPFLLGSFVEMPYTLPQDHTLMTILRTHTRRLWLDKVDFIERWHGMALVNTHPDYLREGSNLAVYEEFLKAMKERSNCWHALPRSVASWWRERMLFRPGKRDGQWDLSGLSGATISHFSATEIHR